MWDLLWTFSYFPSLTKHKTKQTNKTNNKKTKTKNPPKTKPKNLQVLITLNCNQYMTKIISPFFFFYVNNSWSVWSVSPHPSPPISISGIIFCDLTWKNIGIYRSLKLQSFLLHNIRILTSKKPDIFWTVTALKRHFRPYGFTLLKKEFVR